MTRRKITILPLIAVLMAFAYSGWEEFTYRMTPAQKRGWFIMFSIVVLGALAWVLRPYFVKWFM